LPGILLVGCAAARARNLALSRLLDNPDQPEHDDAKLSQAPVSISEAAYARLD
jgi:hypothetical protein